MRGFITTLRRLLIILVLGLVLGVAAIGLVLVALQAQAAGDDTLVNLLIIALVTIVVVGSILHWLGILREIVDWLRRKTDMPAYDGQDLNDQD